MNTKVKDVSLTYWVHKAHEYLSLKIKNITNSDRIKASRLGKSIVLGINETYKKTKDPELMDLMKKVTVKKQIIDKRLRFILTSN